MTVRSCRRRLVLVTPDLEHEVRAVLDRMDPDSQEVFDKEFEIHVVDRGLLRFLTLPAGSVIIRDREDMEALRGVVEATASLLWQISLQHRGRAEG